MRCGLREDGRVGEVMKSLGDLGGCVSGGTMSGGGGGGG